MNQIKTIVYIKYFVLVAAVVIPGLLHAQCSIKASSSSGCVPQPISFSIEKRSGNTVTGVTWDFGDASSSTENSPTHVYQNRGTYTVTAIISYDDNTTCNATYRSNIKVYDNPSAVIDMQQTYKVCWYNTEVTFNEASSVGDDDAKILRYTWDLGDGDTSNRQSFDYSYETNRKYKVVLEVLDENGCKDTVSKIIRYFKYDEVVPNFSKFQKDSCPVTDVLFRNRTDTNGFHIQKVEWDFGNGKRQTAEITDSDWSTKWDSAKALYAGNKVCFPSLSITNKIGCKATFQRYKIENIFFKFDAKATPDSTCYDWGQTGPIVRFTHPRIDNFRKVVWTFGDPQSQSNQAQDIFNPVHEYSEPGRFTVRLRIEKRGCVRDTKYCAMIKVYGAQARINKFPREYNDSLIGHSFYPNSFPENFDTCNTDSFSYYTLDTQQIKKTRYQYCNATKLDSTAIGQASKCKGVLTRYNYTLDASSSYTYLGNKITRKKQVWRKGDPLPKEAVFSSYIGKSLPENLHDSFLFACSVPHTVNFINNSIKYRGYEALDNFTPGYPDSCKNPSYPWASDSLQYFWDFGEGTSDTSTQAKPNKLARFSTERLPKHTYITEGCYKVKMWATDPVTDCVSDDSVYISVQPPDAGWDKVAYDTISRMSYRKQRKLGGGNYRRGLIVKGLECTQYRQTIDITELLPACQLEKYWIVFDSVEQTTYSICNGDTILKHDWIESAKVPKQHVPYRYESTGWKTVGIVVKNGECFDTMWYHNYKYIYTANAFANVSDFHFCSGDTVTTQLVDTMQEGIRYAWFNYEYRLTTMESWDLLETDTLKFINYNKNGSNTHITSSLQKTAGAGNPDDTSYNNLAEISKFQFPKRGVYKITANVLHRFGCEYIDEIEVAVGHRAKFNARHETICLGDSVKFTDTVQYYQSFLASSNTEGVDTTLYWQDPAGKRLGVKPRHTEKIRWDFDNDGVFDAYGSNPKWAYSKPGVYTVVMQTKDSMDCKWLTTARQNYIKVVGITTDFKVAKDDTVRFCAPQLFVFRDNSKVLDGGNPNLDNIQYWQWQWGDGESVLRSKLDNGTTGHLYEHNGEYTVWLKTFLSTYQVTKGKGCVDSTKLKVYTEGPLPKFSLVGDSVGCVPFKTTVKDSSSKTSVWEWHLGNGTTKPSYGEELVDLTYNEPGVYCISLYAGDSIVDYSGKKLFCIDNYPYNECDIKVRVLPKNKIELLRDSLLCINEVGAFDFSESDLGYTDFVVHFGDERDTVYTKNKIVEHAYDSLAQYPLFYTGSGARCPDTAYSTVDVIGIKANFELDSMRLDTPVFWFKNLSHQGVDFEWSFDNKVVTTNDLEDVRNEFQIPGTKQICLIARNERGCSDTLCKWLQIETNIWIPNVMTVNEDGLNDRFKILIKGHTYYDLKVYNRWGELVFESTEFDYLWNGNKFNTGTPCTSGTYFYLFNYKLIGEDEKVRTGSITLLHAR